MITKSDIIEEAHSLGFGDVGFTTGEPFASHLDYLRDHQDAYGWAERAGFDLVRRDRSKNGAPQSAIDHCTFGRLFPGGIFGVKTSEGSVRKEIEAALEAH